MITVVGLGRIEGDLTLRGVKAIQQADYIIARSALTDTFRQLKKDNIITLDHLYEQAEDFDLLNDSIVDFIINYQDKNAVYCVEGSGIDDISVIKLKNAVELNIIPGVGYETYGLSCAPTISYSSIFATDFIARRNFYPDTNSALIIKELDNYYLASDVKLKALSLIGDTDVVYIIGDKSFAIKLSELDRQKEYNHTSMLVIPPTGNYNKSRYNFSDLMEITYRLRDPDGCKWDRAQTHKSIRANAIEEAYELVEAVDLEDVDKMCEESGDVLLQGVFHAVIGESSGEYDITDCLSVLCNKLITRHTHIFGTEKVQNKEEALKAWETAKAKEKGQTTYSEKISSIASNLPALIRAHKVQKTAKKSGFDWKDISGAVNKVYEELNELLTADQEHQEIEGGDLLFAAVNVLRFLDINPELALTRTVDKFVKRFKYMEDRILEQGMSLEQCTLEEMDKYWEEGKNEDSGL